MSGARALTPRGQSEGEVERLATRRPPLTLVGCLVIGTGRSALAAASLLAAYSSRAVLVAERGDLLPLLVDAAFLEIGVVVHRDGQANVLSQPGPRVDNAPTTRESNLIETVYDCFRRSGLSGAVTPSR